MDSSMSDPPKGQFGFEPMPNVDLSETQGPRILGACISTFCLAMVAVIARFMSRRIGRIGIKIDDWLIIIAMIVNAVTLWGFCAVVSLGVGRHWPTVDVNGMPLMGKILFMLEITYIVELAAVKLSFLAFYGRLFDVQSIRLPVYVLTAMSISWLIACIFVLVFQCNPIAGAWNRGIPDIVCMNSEDLFVGTAVPHTVIDILILILPVPYIYRLKVDWKQKWALGCIFLLGGFVCVISIVRLVAVLQTNYTSPDVSWNMSESILWPFVEQTMAVVCACLPSLKPLIRFLARKPRSPNNNHAPRRSFMNMTEPTHLDTKQTISAEQLETARAVSPEVLDNDAQRTKSEGDITEVDEKDIPCI